MKYVVLQFDRKKKEVEEYAVFDSSMDAINHVDHAEKHTDTERYTFFQYKTDSLEIFLSYFHFTDKEKAKMDR